MEVDLPNLIQSVKDIDNCPEQFLKTQKKDRKVENVLQKLYKFSMFYNGVNEMPAALPELVLEDMDEEQIWQQLDIRNNEAISYYLSQVAKVASLHERKLSIKVENGEPTIEKSEAVDNSEIKEGLTVSKKNKPNKKRKEKDEKSEGDRFFNVEEMNKFLDLEDAKANLNGKDIPGDIDFFQEIDNEDEAELKYDDFFGAENDNGSDEDGDDDEGEDENDFNSDKDDDEDGMNNEDVGSQSEKDSNSDDEDDDDVDNESVVKEVQKSNFETRQERRQNQISIHESQMLDEKPWQLKGEIQATGRPQNSLLEEILEFESTVRPAPIITEATTYKLEDLIRQRIKDQTWDDVELKIREKLVGPEYSKQTTLDQEKSKLSLSKIYEMEYQREQNKLDENVENTAQNSEADKIERSMNKLLDKLNTLFHFYITPATVIPEPVIITNTPALQMEDPLPVAVSDANLLAPEEVYQGHKKELIGKSERTKTDKNRERRKKKVKQHAVMKKLSVKQGHISKGLDKIKKSNLPTKSSKSVEMINRNDIHQPKSSKQFFARMQESSVANESKKPTKLKSTRAKDVKL